MKIRTHNGKVLLADVIEKILKEGGKDKKDIVHKVLKYCQSHGYRYNLQGFRITEKNTSRHLNEIIKDITLKIRSKRWHKYKLKSKIQIQIVQ